MHRFNRRAKYFQTDHRDRGKNGDLLLVASRNRVYTAVVYNEQGTMVADAAITVIRSKGKYTGEYIKMYLDSACGNVIP